MPEYFVDVRVQGRMTMLITADGKAAAEAQLFDQVNDDNWSPDLEDVDDVNWHISELIPVIREGKRVKTTFVRAGDVRIEE